MNCSQFGFHQLNYYVLLDIFKYLSLQERVAYERINKRWATLLDALWSQQKHLKFASIPCNNDNVQAERDAANWSKVLFRCSHLKHLHLNGTRAEHFGASFGNDLAQHCPDIEKVTGTSDLVQLLLDYTKQVEHNKISQIQ